VLPALIAVATAQAESFSRGASATAPSGPVDTGSACAQVARLVTESGITYPSIDAEVSLRAFLHKTVEEEGFGGHNEMQWSSPLTYDSDRPRMSQNRPNRYHRRI
jgi:hypothetical protein